MSDTNDAMRALLNEIADFCDSKDKWFYAKELRTLASQTVPEGCLKLLRDIITECECSVRLSVPIQRRIRAVLTTVPAADREGA